MFRYLGDLVRIIALAISIVSVIGIFISLASPEITFRRGSDFEDHHNWVAAFSALSFSIIGSVALLTASRSSKNQQGSE